MTNNIEVIATKDLQQRRANAYYTYCTCGGHTKAGMNKLLVSRYDEQLAERSIEPDENIEGVFNGKGST